MCIPNQQGMTTPMQQTQRTMGIPSASSTDYIQGLVNGAAKDYPFIARHNPVVVLGKGEGYAETYPVGETGRPLGNGKFSRPDSLPRDKVGIEVYQPTKFTAKDLAAELLHVDPVANATREKLAASLTPKQLKVLKQEALDYEATIKEGRSEKDAIKNATDSAMRGYVVNQWPDDVNARMGYSEGQTKLLENLKTYMQTKP